MPAHPLSDEILQEAIELYREHKSVEKAARTVNLSANAFRHRLKQAAKRGLIGYDPVLPGFEIKQITNTPKGDYIKQVPEHGEEFIVPDGHVVNGVSALLDADGHTVLQWIKTKTGAAELSDAIKAAFEEYQGRAELIDSPRHSDDSLLSIYPIADQHNGLLAWGRETGESYDLKIGEERLRNCMARLVSQAPASQQAIILNLGDWQHTDNQYNVTPASGNPLDVDSRYFKILTAGVKLMMDCIELALQKHDTVLVRNIPGNHDPHASIALTVALGAFYSNNPRVRIEDDPGEFFFHRFGQTLIGATHGHRLKADRMAMAMAVMRRDDWGKTRYHWFLHGHIHKEQVTEIGDVRVESFQSLAANDAWSHSSGYTAGKSLTSVTIHAEDGEIGRHRVNIPRP